MIPTHPYRIYLEVTRSCPLQCLHCYIKDTPNLSGELTINDFKNLFGQMIAMNIKELVITGGEPFLRTDILQIIDVASKAGLKVTVLTCGVLINRQLIHAIKNYDIDLRLSLDGITPETHDFIRGKGNFEKVICAFNIIKEIKINKLSVHFTVNRINISEILQLPNFLYHLEIQDVTISTIKPAGRALQHKELLIGPDLMLLVRDRINTVSKSKNIAFHVYTEKNWQGLSCPAAFTKCGIAADGRVTPCVFLGPNFYGESIRSKPLKEIWQNDEIMAKLRNLSVNNQCLFCSQFATLHGGCRARAIYFNGELNAVDPYCCGIKNQQIAMKGFSISTKKLNKKLRNDIISLFY